MRLRRDIVTDYREILSATLYVRLPHRPHDQPQPWQFGAMPFALVRTSVGDKNRRTMPTGVPELLREGHALPAEMPAADRLVLIVAASDVLLTAAMVPPLPPARLRLALPNLVEDMLATDAAPCHIALGPALEAGADDCVSSEDGHEFVCAADALAEVTKALEAKLGEARKSGLVWRPQNTILVDDEAGEKLLRLVDILDDHDDVQHVYANFEVSDALMAKLEG